MSIFLRNAQFWEDNIYHSFWSSFTDEVSTRYGQHLLNLPFSLQPHKTFQLSQRNWKRVWIQRKRMQKWKRVRKSVCQMFQSRRKLLWAWFPLQRHKNLIGSQLCPTAPHEIQNFNCFLLVWVFLVPVNDKTIVSLSRMCSSSTTEYPALIVGE